MIQRYEQSAGTRSRVASAIGSFLGVLVIAEDGGSTPWVWIGRQIAPQPTPSIAADAILAALRV